MGNKIEQQLQENYEVIKSINKCFLEIRDKERVKMKEAREQGKVFDASINNWCVTGEKLLYEYKSSNLDLLQSVVEWCEERKKILIETNGWIDGQEREYYWNSAIHSVISHLTKIIEQNK